MGIMDNGSIHPQKGPESQLSKRSAEEVSQAASTAGLTGTEGDVQILKFSPQLHSEDIRLMEVSGPVLAALKVGEKVVLRGKPSDEAVLCTKDMTFEMRAADTSNSLLIAPLLHLPHPHDGDFADVVSGDGLRCCEVVTCLNTYWELRQCRPRIERLKALLSECPFKGSEYEMEWCEESCSRPGEVGISEERVPMWTEEEEARLKEKENASRKYRFEDLLGVVQASEAELMEALVKARACLINGYWRCLDLDYQDMVFQHILTLLEEKDWPHYRVPLEATCKLLCDLEPRFAIEHCLVCYGRRLETEEESCSSEAADVYFELSEEKVCQFFAELLLRPAGKFIFQDFIESWQQSVPEGMTTSLHQLKGLALTDMVAIPPVIWHFPHSDLPHDPAARFLRLFEVKGKWTLDEIEPYIDDLEGPTQSLKSLLMKFTRVSTTTGGQKVYSSRKII